MNTPHTRAQIASSLAHVVLSQLARLRAERAISDADFETMLRRIEREELTPRGLKLHRRETTGCHVSFLVAFEATGDVCDVVEYQPMTAMA